jgi:hypothetical protein
MLTVMTPPVKDEPMEAFVQVPPEPMAVLDADGAVQPEGTVTVAYEPEVNEEEPLLVNVKTNWFDELGATPLGDTVMVPVPLLVAAAATPGATNGAARAPIINTGRRIRTKRFILIHLSMGSSWLNWCC